MSQWGWTPARNLGIWRYGAGWCRPFVSAAPYLTIGLLLLTMYMVSGTFASYKSVLFELPDGGTFADGADLGAVALVLPVSHETVVIFDDSRYQLGDAASMRSFSEDLAAYLERQEDKSLLILADRRISTGCLMEVVMASKRGGARKLRLAGRRSEGAE